MADNTDKLLDLENQLKNAIFGDGKTMIYYGELNENEFDSMMRMHTRFAMRVYEEHVHEHGHKDHEPPESKELGPDDIRGVLEMFRHLSNKSNSKDTKPNYDDLDNAVITMHVLAGLSEAIASMTGDLSNTYPGSALVLADLLQTTNWKLGSCISTVLKLSGEKLDKLTSSELKDD